MARDAYDRKWNSIGPMVLVGLLGFATCTSFVRDAWAVQAFQIGAFAMLAICLVTLKTLAIRRVSLLVPAILLCGAPFWGLAQISMGRTASIAQTLEAVLRWGGLVAVFLIARLLTRRVEQRERFLEGFVWFATAMSVLSLTQMFSSEGKVLWMFDSGYPSVFGTIAYHNHYAQFVELALPVALWRALFERRRWWAYAVAGGALYASVIGCASRAGTILCTLELVVLIVVGLMRFRGAVAGSAGARFLNLPSRKAAVTLALVPLAASVFTLVVGWERVWQRFQEQDPFAVRREFLNAAVDMARHRPMTGYGLGTFPAVYQSYAVVDFPFIANQAHNDWAQFGAEGGIPFLLLILIPFLRVVPWTFRYTASLGITAVMLHACVDYPFPKPAVAGWLFGMLGMLYAALDEPVGSEVRY
jgi:hypothetical protein